MSTNYPNLPQHLRKWGLKVEESEGWRTRGRPFAFRPRAVFCHHTASGSQSGNFASNNVVKFGRPDLPGPLCQFLLGRDGTVRIISGGYANHAGTGGGRSVVPRNMGNTYGWGIEAENNGVGERWSEKQLNAYYRLCAALLDLMNTKDVNRVFGHKEWTSRKIDPAGIHMPGFRQRVKQALNHGPSVQSIMLDSVKPGKKNKYVWRVKNRLHKRGYFKNDKITGYFGKDLREAIAAFQKDQGWKGKDADGLVGPGTLRKLGFDVK